MKYSLLVYAATLSLIFFSQESMATTLPDGTCSGGGMTVIVKGGKITKYSYGGQSYSVRPINPSAYKIGTAGALRVSSPKADGFRAIFAMNGRETSATFKCK
ncbi:hypothetical protein [Mesorhizobium sp. J428]|uniref:hypothetical protein n=1 Tax=Mesorhizobium sp. J428 TaxID=2898440 RepID=UPI002151A624|nr:hypothetical protein [Mesorhizobium sp. J428]MCR5856121.1 hypothetical protein [Mesorhizobium sp. J428]